MMKIALEITLDEGVRGWFFDERLKVKYSDRMGKRLRFYDEGLTTCERLEDFDDLAGWLGMRDGADEGIERLIKAVRREEE